jgi:hypothetical protein
VFGSHLRWPWCNWAVRGLPTANRTRCRASTFNSLLFRIHICLRSERFCVTIHHGGRELQRRLLYARRRAEPATPRVRHGHVRPLSFPVGPDSALRKLIITSTSDLTQPSEARKTMSGAHPTGDVDTRRCQLSFHLAPPGSLHGRAGVRKPGNFEGSCRRTATGTIKAPCYVESERPRSGSNRRL